MLIQPSKQRQFYWISVLQKKNLNCRCRRTPNHAMKPTAPLRCSCSVVCPYPSRLLLEVAEARRLSSNRHTNRLSGYFSYGKTHQRVRESNPCTGLERA